MAKGSDAGQSMEGEFIAAQQRVGIVFDDLAARNFSARALPRRRGGESKKESAGEPHPPGRPRRGLQPGGEVFCFGQDEGSLSRKRACGAIAELVRFSTGRIRVGGN